ncbi:MAG: 3'-5' exoribonuclease [Armatimonadetes bacterium]|nr:3'-5' exoribonuclease [Armatimonadota bacterium]
MRVFYDTEFLSEPPELHLISIGMVREDGAELSVVNKCAPWDRILTHPWLSENVVPHLPPEYHPSWQTPEEIRLSLVDFCGHEPEFWAWFGSFDWVVLVNLFGQFRDVPYTWPHWSHELKQLMEKAGVSKLPARRDNMAHDALADARFVKNGYDWCTKVLAGTVKASV